eukprot:m.160140 g.160140  ORF g.160140 m.160140 type:complete len:99 (-) comp13381_c0_seq1:351-647(-)
MKTSTSSVMSDTNNKIHNSGLKEQNLDTMTTFTYMVEVAFEKNERMMRNQRRSLHASLLQKSFWTQLQETYVASPDKVALVNTPIDNVTLVSPPSSFA